MFIKKKSLAHGQVPTKFSLARLEKPLAPGVGQWDLSAPDVRQHGQRCLHRLVHVTSLRKEIRHA
jgi:hypothetical protein